MDLAFEGEKETISYVNVSDAYSIEVNMESVNSRIIELISSIEDDLSSGLLYTHTRITDNTKKTLESASFLYALIELLSEKGLITIEELDERKKQVAERLVKKFTESGLGLMYRDPEYDKYTFEHAVEIDGSTRFEVCKAACCRLPFALSRQDIEEGIIRWEFGRPYLIAHDRDGYCVHLDKRSYQCSVYEQRPVPCRGFNCSNGDKWRVWLDYQGLMMNPEFEEQIRECNGKLYSSCQR